MWIGGQDRKWVCMTETNGKRLAVECPMNNDGCGLLDPMMGHDDAERFLAQIAAEMDAKAEVR